MINRELIYLSSVLRNLGIFFAYAHNGSKAGYKEEVKKKLYFLFENTQLKKEEKDAIIALSSDEGGEASEILRQADEWAIGRKRHAEEQTICRPLPNIFNEIGNTEGNSFYIPSVLSLNEKCFPIDKEEAEKIEITERAEELWNKFEEEWRYLPAGTVRAYADTLLFLIKKYCWSLNAGYDKQSPANLFEYIKISAAFADCIFATKENGVKYPALLVGGDISGIQAFIYNIASRKAAVSLKGRSFYLQLLIDSVIDAISLHENIRATPTNIVYSSGGKFFMLLPNLPEIREALTEVKKDVENELWEKQNGDLAINIGYIPFRVNPEEKSYESEDESFNELGGLWKILNDKLTSLKWRKYQDRLITDFDQLFNPSPIARDKDSGKAIDYKVCAVTGIESPNCVILDNKAEEKTWVLPSVKRQAELGRVLKDADYILKHTTNTNWGGEENTAIKYHTEIAGVKTLLFDNKLLVNNRDDILNQIPNREVVAVRKINKLDFIDTQFKGQRISYGFQFYGGNKQAENKNGNKTFEELADNEYLGILRMDVDNLGAIFIKGIPEKYRNFASYATLSFILDYFFSGYLNEIRERHKDYVNILYSGGDDVFAIGKWDELTEFAYTLRRNFKKLTGKEEISISGGIVMVKDKYPIAKAAEMAGEAEDKAKHLSKEKNAFNLFDISIRWNGEFDFVRKYKEEFVRLCSLPQGAMATSILHALNKFAIMALDNDLSFIYKTAYYLKRFRDRSGLQVEEFVKQELEPDLMMGRAKKISQDRVRIFQLIAVAARWAELTLRFEKKITNI